MGRSKGKNGGKNKKEGVVGWQKKSVNLLVETASVLVLFTWEQFREEAAFVRWRTQFLLPSLVLSLSLWFSLSLSLCCACAFEVNSYSETRKSCQKLSFHSAAIGGGSDKTRPQTPRVDQLVTFLFSFSTILGILFSFSTILGTTSPV